jgi:hypothetical protein
VLRRLLRAAPGVRIGALVGLSVVLLRCGGVGDPDPTGVVREAIVGGNAIVDPGSPVVLLREPQGLCTGVMVAPNLVATVRHCTAQIVDGPFTCTPAGTLVPSASGAGLIGTEFSPAQITFLESTTVAGVAAKDLLAAEPDGVGARIISTGASTACSDDLAFVVLAAPIPGLRSTPVRLTNATPAGDPVSAWGYGLTAQSAAAPALRVRNDVSVLAVGPSTPVALTQGAPLRAVRIGPGTVTCSGDSGDPITSNATGALIAVASLGPLAGLDQSCPETLVSDTTGPLLANYPDLVLSAFAAAGASPNLEASAVATPDAGTASGTTDGGAEGAGPAGASGATCAAAPRGARAGAWPLVLAGTAAVARRRRRP